MLGKKLKLGGTSWQSRAIRTRCRQGHSHPSKAEANHCDLLHLKLKARNCTWQRIEYEKKYPLEIKGILVGTHKPDWSILHQDGSWSVVEYKGYHQNKREWKFRMKVFMALYPDIEYTVVRG